MKTELETFYELIEDLDTAMMTTRRADGHLHRGRWQTNARSAGADLWFVTTEGSAKLEDLEHDPHLNLSYYRDSNREWVSVSGIATIVPRPRRRFASCTNPTGGCGSPKRAIPGMGRRTIRGWS